MTETRNSSIDGMTAGADGKPRVLIVGAVLTEIDARAGLMSVEESRKLLGEVFGPITPLSRSGRAEEVAEAIEYLSFAEWTTGAVLDVDGGLGLGTVETYQDPMERRM